ncbi:ABC transporter permease [Paenibacillus sp. 598K]|uniref:ABC transporter permease n=1 Tax=Paenibacillus sp. 598K TaxID=1117987 RepID=UPI000FF9D0EB|nr:ABC transporter permease [Paenibacillus sp. 598K]GBF76019.1 ABC transporter permease [Paenibacillus sp. 598K]
MFDFLQLVNNENMKIYRRLRTWIMLAILLLLSLVIPLMTYVYGGGTSVSMWDILIVQSAIGIMLATVFAVVIAAETVAGEFSTGTIKLLMIRPWSRSKILLSKYVALLLFGLFFIAVTFAWSVLTSMLFFGYSNEALGTSGMNPLSYWIQYYLYEFVTLAITVTLAFLISTVFRSGGLAIGLSLFLLLGGGIVTGIIRMLDYAWVDYLLFANMALTDYLNSDVSTITGKPIGFTLAVLGGYYVAFLAITWWVFNKRDIA